MAARRIARVICLHSPMGLCAKCIAKQAETSSTTAIKITKSLEATDSYFRSLAICSWCGAERLCTHAIDAGTGSSALARVDAPSPFSEFPG
jgi:hypothetical protein